MSPPRLPEIKNTFTLVQRTVLSVICIALFTYKLYLFDIEVLNLSYYLGGDIGNAFGLWLIFVIFFARHLEGRFLLLSFLLIALSGTTVTTIKFYSKINSVRQSITSFESDLNQRVETGDRSSLVGQEEVVKPRPENNLEIAFSYFQDLRLQMATLGQQYEEKLSAIRFESIFDQEMLRDPAARSRYKALFQKAEAILTEIRKEHEKLVVRAIEGAEELNLPPRFKTPFLSSARSSISSLKDEYGVTWQLEAETIAELKKAVDVLVSNPDAWETINGQFFFHDEQVGREFSTHTERISEILEQQQALLERHQQRMAEKLGDLRELYD